MVHINIKKKKHHTEGKGSFPPTSTALSQFPRAWLLSTTAQQCQGQVYKSRRHAVSDQTNVTLRCLLAPGEDSRVRSWSQRARSGLGRRHSCAWGTGHLLVEQPTSYLGRRPAKGMFRQFKTRKGFLLLSPTK